MKRILRLVLINVVVLLFLSIGLNVVSFFLLRNSSSSDQTEGSDYPYRASRRSELLNNGKDSAYNRLVLDEFYKLQTEYMPYTVWTRKPFKGKTTTINKVGDRVHDVSGYEVFDSSQVIRFFGGSTIWGTGVDDNGTIPAFFNQLNPTTKVHNHGESGFVSRQNLARLVNILNQNEAVNTVVFYDGFNDIDHLCRKEVGYNSHDRAMQINGFIETAKSIESNRYLIERFLNLVFVKFTKMYFSGTDNETRNGHYKCCLDEETLEHVASTLCNNWMLAHQICQARGIEFHAILQPSAFVGEPIFDERFRIIRTDCMPEVYPRIYEMVHERMKSFDWYHDLRSVLNGTGPWYIDACHVSDPANEIIAKEIDRIIKAEPSVENDSVTDDGSEGL